MKRLAFSVVIGILVVVIAYAVPAWAVPLNIVEVNSPNINCLYVSPCTILVSNETSDSVAIGVGGSNYVSTRTFSGQPGTQANSFTAYVYQVSMAQTVTQQPERCLTSMTLNFGHVINAFDYNRDGVTGDQVFVIASGGTGSIGLSAAEKMADEIKFTFSEPICSGSTSAEGGSSLMFGLVSTQQPHITTASLRGAPVFRDYDVEVRTPMIQTFSRLTLELFDMDRDRMLSDAEFFNAIDMWLTQETISGTDTQIDDLTFFRLIDWWVGGSPIIFDFEPLSASLDNHTLRFASERISIRLQGENITGLQINLYSTSGERVLTQATSGSALSFKAQNSDGQPLANGIYFYTITGWDGSGASVTSEVKKLAVVR